MTAEQEFREWLEQGGPIKATVREYGLALLAEVGELRELGTVEHSACERALAQMEDAVMVMDAQRKRAEQAEAEVDRLSRDRGMLKSVHGALVDAGCRMGEIGHCEADLVREVTRQRDYARAEVERAEAKLAEVESILSDALAVLEAPAASSNEAKRGLAAKMRAAAKGKP